MTKKKTRKLPTYLQELDGRYFARVPVKPELQKYVGGTQLRAPLGPDLRTAKTNLHYHVVLFKEQLRKAAAEYARDTGNEIAFPTAPVDPSRLVAHHYREMIAYDDFARNADQRYSTFGYIDDTRVSSLRAGMAGKLSDEEYAVLLQDVLERAFPVEAQVPENFDFRALARDLCAAQFEGLSRMAERDEGDFTGKPQHPVVVEALDREKREQQAAAELKPFDLWTFEAVIEEQERRAALGLGRVKSKATLNKYRVAQYDFEHFRKDKKVATVTLANGKAWRDHMLAEGKLSRKSVKDRITNIRTLLGWANTQAENQMFPQGDPWAVLELPTVEKRDSAERTYSLKDARHLLAAARSATRASNRWIPWIIAHTGARVNEITVLDKADVFEIEGYWFINIRVGDGRDTKTHKGRKVPVHRALLREGFVDWVGRQPEGKLFPGGENEDQRIREWIREKVFPGRADLPPPNHGFRHLFEDALFADVSHKAALYITGRSSGSSADEYGGSELKLVEIARQMEKVGDILPVQSPESAKENG